MLKHVVGVAAVLVTASIGTASIDASDAAQEPRAQESAQREQQIRARYNISVMEGILERAVQHGADRLSRQVRRMMPDMMLLTGEAQARGFRLEGYGVFFDVAVPVMRQTVAWNLRTIMNESDIGAGAALRQLKTAIERTVGDAREKAALMQALKRLELQVAPSVKVSAAPAVAGATPRPADPGSVAALDTSAAPESGLTPDDAAVLEDPNGAYEREVIIALKHAMLENSGSIRIGPDEWLTVAAHDNEHRNRLLPGEPYDLLTIVLRVKGNDLAAYRADRITLEEALTRVLVSEF